MTWNRLSAKLIHISCLFLPTIAPIQDYFHKIPITHATILILVCLHTAIPCPPKCPSNIPGSTPPNNHPNQQTFAISPSPLFSTHQSTFSPLLRGLAGNGILTNISNTTCVPHQACIPLHPILISWVVFGKSLTIDGCADLISCFSYLLSYFPMISEFDLVVGRHWMECKYIFHWERCSSGRFRS